MFDIVLYEPEIAPNTGNVLRLAANTGARLHLVRPLGYTLSDRTLARAGLDYAARTAMTVHDDWPACLSHFSGQRMLAVTTRGHVRYDTLQYALAMYCCSGRKPAACRQPCWMLFRMRIDCVCRCRQKIGVSTCPMPSQLWSMKPGASAASATVRNESAPGGC